MERLAESREREGVQESVHKKRRKQGGQEIMGYLQEKAEKENEVRREEIEINRRELDLKQDWTSDRKH